MSFTLHKRTILNQSGQTMVDLVVALALISGSVASAGALSTASSHVALDSSHRTEAIGLAEREMEALRSYRDSFERAGTLWDTTLLGAAGCSYFIMSLSGTEWTPVDVHSNIQTDYTLQTGGDSSLQAKYSGFSRIVSSCPANDFQQTDYASKNPSGPLNSSSTTHLRAVTITVQYLEGTKTKTLVERSLLGDYEQ